MTTEKPNEKDTLEIGMHRTTTVRFVEDDNKDRRILLDVTSETKIAFVDKLGSARTGTFTVKELFEAAEEKRALNSPTCAPAKKVESD